MAHILLASIQLTYKIGVARILIVCHAPFISDYSYTRKCLLASTRDVALEQYRIVLTANNVVSCSQYMYMYVYSSDAVNRI